jgi:hypothetical protein
MLLVVSEVVVVVYKKQVMKAAACPVKAGNPLCALCHCIGFLRRSSHLLAPASPYQGFLIQATLGLLTDPATAVTGTRSLGAQRWGEGAAAAVRCLPRSKQKLLGVPLTATMVAAAWLARKLTLSLGMGWGRGAAGTGVGKRV